jgi:AcrR family transcriptional regulator
MDGFERRKEQSKEDIRRAAEELFSKFGTEKVSINDIARKAGVSQATIYNNFGNKDELVKDYQHTIIRVLATKFHGVLIWKKNWVEKLQGVMQQWLDIADQYQVATTGRGAVAENDPMRKELISIFRNFLKEGREQGYLRSDLPDEVIITYIMFIRQGVAANPEVRERMKHDPKYAQDLISLFTYGISSKQQ